MSQQYLDYNNLAHRLRCVFPVAALALAAALPAAVAAGPHGAVEGIWQTAPRDNGAYLSVRIEACITDPAAVCGTVVGSHNGAKAEFVGDPILVGMKPAGHDAWDGGEIIRPGRGTRYASKLRLIDEGLEVRGCVAGGLFCGAQIWTRP